ncbi:hypothetical protein, variant [Exophiala sideris]|nr:hypothetical protein, variant [Exophiala sideris]
MLILGNLGLSVPSGPSVYDSVLAAWKAALAFTENVVNGIPQTVQSAAVMLALSAWHLYPDLAILGDRPKPVKQGDELICHGGIVTIGLQKDSPSNDMGITWSLPLSHLRYYGEPVQATVSLGTRSSLISMEELLLVCFGAVTTSWVGPKVNNSHCARLIIGIQNTLLHRHHDPPAWLELLGSIASTYQKYTGDRKKDADKLIQFGRRRCPSFLSASKTSIPLAFNIQRPSVFLKLLYGTEPKIRWLRNLFWANKDNHPVTQGLIAYKSTKSESLIPRPFQGLGTRQRPTQQHPRHPDSHCSAYPYEYSWEWASLLPNFTDENHKLGHVRWIPARAVSRRCRNLKVGICPLEREEALMGHYLQIPTCIVDRSSEIEARTEERCVHLVRCPQPSQKWERVIWQQMPWDQPATRPIRGFFLRTSPILQSTTIIPKKGVARSLSQYVYHASESAREGSCPRGIQLCAVDTNKWDSSFVGITSNGSERAFGPKPWGTRLRKMFPFSATNNALSSPEIRLNAEVLKMSEICKRELQRIDLDPSNSLAGPVRGQVAEKVIPDSDMKGSKDSLANGKKIPDSAGKAQEDSLADRGGISESIEKEWKYYLATGCREQLEGGSDFDEESEFDSEDEECKESLAAEVRTRLVEVACHFTTAAVEVAGTDDHDRAISEPPQTAADKGTTHSSHSAFSTNLRNDTPPSLPAWDCKRNVQHCLHGWYLPSHKTVDPPAGNIAYKCVLGTSAPLGLYVPEETAPGASLLADEPVFADIDVEEVIEALDSNKLDTSELYQYLQFSDAEHWSMDFRQHLESLGALAYAQKVYSNVPDARVNMAVTSRPVSQYDWVHPTTNWLAHARAFSCIATFESGHLSIAPQALKTVMGISTGHSLYMTRLLSSDPYSPPAPSTIRRSIGNIGKPGLVFLISPGNPKVKDPQYDNWQSIQHQDFDGRLESSFDRTSVHLSLTGYEQAVDIGEHGFLDKQAYFVEAATEVYERANWITDLDIVKALNSDIGANYIRRLPRREANCHQETDVLKCCCCHHAAEERDDYSKVAPITSIDSWDELLDPPDNAGIVRAGKANWFVRLTAVVLGVQMLRPVVIASDSVCWACVKDLEKVINLSMMIVVC